MFKKILLVVAGLIMAGVSQVHAAAIDWGNVCDSGIATMNAAVSGTAGPVITIACLIVAVAVVIKVLHKAGR